MKCMRRTRPPPAPAPAGLNRTPQSAIERWESDQYAYPPYQYKRQYLIWSDQGWQLLNAEERELLHGYGFGHSAVAMSSSNIKRNPQEYEDLRCSLVGDSFSMYSFVIFSWGACRELCKGVTYAHLANRMGVAPGFCAPIAASCPLERNLVYGSAGATMVSVSDLTRVLLTRVNHTGSDARVTSGRVMSPKAFPRQSACADWWQWKHVFTCRWSTREHINRLEMRSILLSFKWRVRHLLESQCRFIHWTDSYVSMSVISKGRSSSLMLMSVMQKIAAFQFGFGLFPVLIHVESTENPTDDASRR